MLMSRLEIQRPLPSDVEEMIKLYFTVYGHSYPINYGRDPELLLRAISSDENHMVYIARDREFQKIVGICIYEIDRFNKIGKVVGLVVHPDYRRQNLGHDLVTMGSETLIHEGGDLNSLYATTRTLSLGPQLIFLKDDYLPLGIFPNAHRLKQYETLTLLAKFKVGVLERRQGPRLVSPKLMPLYRALHSVQPLVNIPECGANVSLAANKDDSGGDWEYEAIKAPAYVSRRFREKFPKPEDRFFPFHTPNFLISEKKARGDFFGYFSESDGYCTLISTTTPFAELDGNLTTMLMLLHDLRVSYVECLVPVEDHLAIEVLTRNQFVPSAIYPAMREVAGELKDYVVLSRSMEPLNFRGMSVVGVFKPFIDQYVELWKQMSLESLEFVNE